MKAIDFGEPAFAIDMGETMTYVYPTDVVVNPIEYQYLQRLKFTNDIKDFRYISEGVRPVLLIEV